MLKNISFITAHFYDFAWTELLVKNIRRSTPDSLIREIIIINQDRNKKSQIHLESLDPFVRVVEYPKSEQHFLWTRHDHAAVLNTAVKEAKGDYIFIFDSDAHPMSDQYVKNCEKILENYDAILAEDPTNPNFTHPCFMLIRQRHIQLNLTFDQGLFENCTDTGRLIGKQLLDSGECVFICRETPAFGGKWGSIYLDSIYHHGHGSFKGVNDELLQKQIRWENEYFREYIISHQEYNLSLRSAFSFYLKKSALKIKFVNSQKS